MTIPNKFNYGHLSIDTYGLMIYRIIYVIRICRIEENVLNT